MVGFDPLFPASLGPPSLTTEHPSRPAAPEGTPSQSFSSPQSPTAIQNSSCPGIATGTAGHNLIMSASCLTSRLACAIVHHDAAQELAKPACAVRNVLGRVCARCAICRNSEPQEPAEIDIDDCSQSKERPGSWYRALVPTTQVGSKSPMGLSAWKSVT